MSEEGTRMPIQIKLYSMTISLNFESAISKILQ